MCRDTCNDSTETFFVTRALPAQECDWLKVRRQWLPVLCYPTHPAYHICGETCDSCDGYAGPPPPEYKAGCDDSATGTFLVNNKIGHKDCNWLSKNLIWHSRMCVPGKAYDLCEETCRKCTDMCEDDANVTFYVNRNQGIRDCEWLSTRPNQQKSVCYDGHKAYTYCKETCDNCVMH